MSKMTSVCLIRQDGLATLWIPISEIRKEKKENKRLYIQYNLKNECLIRDLMAHFTRHSNDRLQTLIIKKNFTRFTPERREEFVCAIFNKPRKDKTCIVM